ncbi:GNAT family N-acetyltransferase [Planomonospora alba]|uniref:GNAT family N-acetyltransferase n=1 Tax=Planomonospora alba TaxID=161354 RepID=A0ABP6NCZ1_9ACTN
MAPSRKIPGGSGRIPTITPERLARGWSGPNGTKIRTLADGEADRWLELLELAGVEHEDVLLSALRGGALGWLLPLGLSAGRKAMKHRFLETVLERTEEAAAHAMAGLSVPLIVQDRDGHLIGALNAVSLPPPVVASAADRGVPFEVMIEALTTVVKIRAVAVDEQARGQGIGSALLTRCLQVYFQLGFHLAYGHFRAGSGLEVFYSGCGFDVLAEQSVLDFGVYLGLPFRLLPEEGERIFACVSER